MHYLEEEWKAYQLHQFFGLLTKSMPQEEQWNELCQERFRQFVYLTFSANVLHQGLSAACRLYNHIVKVEYTRLCRYICQQAFDGVTTERLLAQMRQTRNELLKSSPCHDHAKGMQLFFNEVGGFRKKYVKRQKSILTMYQLIVEASQKKYAMYLKDYYVAKKKKYIAQKKYWYWKWKTYIWH